MNNKINQIILSIQSKSDSLKEKARREFDTIKIPQANSFQVSKNQNNKKTPPITYILYGVSALSVLGALTCDATASKIILWGIAATSAIGGFRLSVPTANGAKNNRGTTTIELNSLKSDVTSQIITIVKNIKNEWEQFMEEKQQVIRSIIQSASIDDSIKDSLLSKIFIYEVVDIKISTLSSLVNEANDLSTIQHNLDFCKNELINSIELACKRQSEKYNFIRL